MTNFWTKLPKPFISGAPMDDVTDVAFRTVIARRGKPDVTYTEFTSADGLVLAPEPGKSKLLAKLAFSDAERPIVAQLFSAVPERMFAAAKLCAELGFDGVDINTGCPDKTVEKQGCGSALIKNPQLFRELYRAAVRGVTDAAHARNTEVESTYVDPIPVSVKCRIGYSKPEIHTWIRTILEEKPPSLCVHLRTRDEMSKVPAHWEMMPEIVALRDEISPETVLSGNGDIKDAAEAIRMARTTGCDGVMIGRGMFGNPWYGTMHIASKEERIEALREHIQEFEQQLARYKSFAVMKKHFGSYMSGFDGAHDIRIKLMETNCAEEALKILRAV